MRNGHYKQTYREIIALTDSAVVRGWLAALVVGLVALPFVANSYVMSIATLICIQVVGVLGLNLLTGNAGQISLGYSGFLAIGAYANAIVTIDLHLPAPLGILCGGLAAGVLGIVLGLPSLRLKGLYLAITTLAFAIIVNHLIVEGGDLTRGSKGIFVPELSICGWKVNDVRAFYFVCLLFASGFTVLALNLVRSRIGRAWLALHEHEIAARTMGVNLLHYKLVAFVVSSFFIGVSGALYAHYLRYLNVDNFSPLIGIEALAMIISGGLGSVLGSIMGVLFLNLLPEFTRLVFALSGPSLSGLFSTNAIELRGVIFGLVIILFLRLEPEGFAGIWREAKRIWTQWPFAR